MRYAVLALGPAMWLAVMLLNDVAAGAPADFTAWIGRAIPAAMVAAARLFFCVKSMRDE